MIATIVAIPKAIFWIATIVAIPGGQFHDCNSCCNNTQRPFLGLQQFLQYPEVNVRIATIVAIPMTFVTDRQTDGQKIMEGEIADRLQRTRSLCN